MAKGCRGRGAKGCRGRGAKGCRGKGKRLGLCSKNKSKNKSEEVVDRISDLHDDIICHILSFLPTRDSVQTSVLSKRWKSLWKSVTTLDFDLFPGECYWYHHDGYALSSNEYYCDCPPHKKKTMLFAATILDQRETKCIKRLSIRNFDDESPEGCEGCFVNPLVSAALTQKVEEINLLLHHPLEDAIDTIFCCKTLSVLKLYGEINLNNIPSIQLPSLKVLDIGVGHRSPLLNDESLMRLSSACPVLQEFYFYDESTPSVPDKILCVPSLKKLKLWCHKGSQIETLVGDHLPNLVRVNLRTKMDFSETECVNKFFNGVRQTKSLVLYYEDTLSKPDFRLFPHFLNLVHLKLRLNTINRYFIMHLLARCPVLQILDIFESMFFKRIEGEWKEPVTPIPSCLPTHLVEFKYKHYDGYQDQDELIKYILNNAKLLKTVTIHIFHCTVQSRSERIMSKLDALLSSFKDGSSTNYQIIQLSKMVTWVPWGPLVYNGD